MSLADDVTLDVSPRVIAILRSGILAEDFFKRGGHAEVAAVFERSFYLSAGDMFLCVGAPAIGNGPLTLIADIGRSVRWSDLGLRRGQRADVSARHITIGGAIRFRLAACEPWRPPAWPSPLPGARLTAACTALARRATAEAPAEGLARVVFGAPEAIAGGVTSFSRIAHQRIASFALWLSAAIASSPSPRDRNRLLPISILRYVPKSGKPDFGRGEGRGEGGFPRPPTRGEFPSPGAQGRADLSPQAGRGVSPDCIRGLIGLGPGLTPSGDDFLSGALALLDALAMRKIHAALAQAVTDAAPALTSPLSACLLKAAADGHIGEHLHDAVAALIVGDTDTAVATARRIGHSSGWDMLAGAATTLRIVARSPAARMECASART